MQLCFAASLCLLLCSCAEEGPVRKETYPVTGEVYVDGQPAADVAVTCNDVKGLDTEMPTTSSGVTDQNGRFQISTYESSDGVPPGEYTLTFMWGQRNLMTMSYGGPDKLNGRYSDPKASEVRFTVESGKPADLGQIQLTTK